MNIHILGNDGRLKYCAELLRRQSFLGVKDITLLPIPSCRDGVNITGTDINLSETLTKMNTGDVLLCYGLSNEARRNAVSRGVTVVDVEGDEGFLEENAYLTAVGTVGRILCEEKSAPTELSVGVIGYGRIGQQLVRMFMFLGANVTVFTSKTELRRDMQMLGVCGIDSLSMSAIDADVLSRLDILINTAPAKLIKAELTEALSAVRVIELASGKNFPETIGYETFQSVPCVMYPASAGAALYKSLIRMLDA